MDLRRPPTWLALSVLLLASACGDETSEQTPTTPPATGGGGGTGGAGGAEGGGGAGGGGSGPAPGAAFDRFCRGAAWDAALGDGAPGKLEGEYVGMFVEPPASGSLETMKVIPEHPFWAKTIRVAYGGAAGGPTRLRLMTTFGRSYPGGWPDIETPEANLITPVEIEVPEDPDQESWIEIDIAAQGAFLEPTQHYVIVNEQLGTAPLVAVESLTGGESSRAMLHVPKQFEPYGLDGNFRMEIRGQYFCSWSEAERYFGLRDDAAFADEPAGDVSVTDLDGDHHDDLVLQAPGPKAFLGDGKGSFAEPVADPFDELGQASLLVFADIDNDGDRDAFAMSYVTMDGDGDHYGVLDGDCNDTDAAVHPGAKEAPNGYDDDCDGVADDGTDTKDADGDGTSIAQGDCDDTRADVFPKAPELHDARDNDCDGQTDEDFVNHIALNDGKGHFAVVPGAGVETIDPSTTAGFGDADGDGILDLYWGNWLVHYPDFPAVQDRYVVGKGDGTFVDATEAAGLIVDPVRPCYGLVWNDYDNDGLQDIFVGNYQLSDNYLWQNQGDGTFVDVAAKVHVDHDDIPTKGGSKYPGGHSYGGTFGDVGFDGDVDFFLANLSHPRTQPWADPSQFFINGGPPDYVFENKRAELGIIYDEGDINSAFVDYDNDTDLDLMVASVYPTHYPKLYRNDGTAGYVDVTYEAGISVESAGRFAWIDVDEDGDLDLVVPGPHGPPYVRLYENRVGQDKAWVEIELRGKSTNRDAVGARLSLTAGGITQLREVKAGEAHRLQHTHLVHFGLGDAAKIDAASVRWTGGGTEKVSGLAPGSRYLVVEGSGKAAALD
ncbi:MAG: VCBS repeat-containing protein [Deltaproteobacteria bacterium]|nr:VCBS repeat-containing protein [Deltaproteobacteria bacterium]